MPNSPNGRSWLRESGRCSQQTTREAPIHSISPPARISLFPPATLKTPHTFSPGDVRTTRGAQDELRYFGRDPREPPGRRDAARADNGIGRGDGRRLLVRRVPWT